MAFIKGHSIKKEYERSGVLILITATARLYLVIAEFLVSNEISDEIIANISFSLSCIAIDYFRINETDV